MGILKICLVCKCVSKVKIHAPAFGYRLSHLYMTTCLHYLRAPELEVFWRIHLSVLWIIKLYIMAISSTIFQLLILSWLCLRRSISIWLRLKSSITFSKFSLLFSFYLFGICNLLKMCIAKDLAEYFLFLFNFVYYIWKWLCKHIYVCEMERDQHSSTSLLNWVAMYARNSHCIAFNLICVNLQGFFRSAYLCTLFPFFKRCNSLRDQV